MHIHSQLISLTVSKMEASKHPESPWPKYSVGVKSWLHLSLRHGFFHGKQAELHFHEAHMWNLNQAPVLLMATLSFCFISADETLRQTACCNSELLQASTLLLPTGCMSLLSNILPWLWAVHSLMLLLLAGISENHMALGLLSSSTRLKLSRCVSETTKESKLYGKHLGKSGCTDKSGSFMLSQR